jgi:hypothetical protein
VKEAAEHVPCALRCAAFLNPSKRGGPRGSALLNEGGRAAEVENVYCKQIQERKHREKEDKNKGCEYMRRQTQAAGGLHSRRGQVAHEGVQTNPPLKRQEEKGEVNQDD